MLQKFMPLLLTRIIYRKKNIIGIHFANGRLYINSKSTGFSLHSPVLFYRYAKSSTFLKGILTNILIRLTKTMGIQSQFSLELSTIYSNTYDKKLALCTPSVRRFVVTFSQTLRHGFTARFVLIVRTCTSLPITYY